MKKVLTILLALASPALAQNIPNHNIPAGRGPGSSGFGAIAPGGAGSVLISNGANADPSFQGLGSIGNSLANLTALQAATISTYPNGVWRLTYGNGNGAEPLFYQPQNSACALNAGNGDNGLQVKSADSKCWIAQFPAGGASVLQYGALPDNATNNSSIIQSAINNLPANGYNIIIPPGLYCVFTGVTIPPAPGIGYATHLIGYTSQSSILSACNHDTSVLTVQGAYAFVENLSLFGRGSNSTDTFSFTAPTLTINGGNNDRFSNMTILGGYHTIYAYNFASSLVFDNVLAYNAYGDSNFLAQNASWVNMIHGQLDQSWPGAVDTSSDKTYIARQNTHAYLLNDVVSLSGYYIQATTAGTSGGSPPALKPYNADITDGSVVWKLLAPVVYVGFNCDTGCNEMEFTNTDFAGPYSNNFAMNNSLAGVAPIGVTITDSTFSFNLSHAIAGLSGSLLQVKGGSISGCATNGCAGIILANFWSGQATIDGVQMTGSFTYGAVNAAGTNNIFVNNVVPAAGLYGYLAESGAANFNVSNNQFSTGTAVFLDATAGDHITVLGNSLNGGTITDNTAATDKLIFNSGTILASTYGGTGGLTGLVKGNGSSAPTAYAGTSGSAHQFVTALSAAGVGTFAQPTPTDVSLGNVTNDAQTKAAIVPNTAPLAGGLLVGNAGGTAYAPVALSGDGSLASTGALTVNKTGGISFAASATTDTTNASNITSGTVATAVMGNAAWVRIKLIGANLNTTADQAIMLTLPTGSTNFRFTTLGNITISNPSISMTTAVCGVWTGAGKTGVTVVGSSAVGVAMSGLTQTAANTTGNAINVTINNQSNTYYNLTGNSPANTLYFACSTAQGATATADVTMTLMVLN